VTGEWILHSHGVHWGILPSVSLQLPGFPLGSTLLVEVVPPPRAFRSEVSTTHHQQGSSFPETRSANSGWRKKWYRTHFATKLTINLRLNISHLPGLNIFAKKVIQHGIRSKKESDG